MTVEEIKQQYSMEDVVNMYGYTPNRSDFIQCPFHTGDRTASLKVYKDSFNCFGCHANGDIFKFIQLIEDCDFKTAYFKLGGTYKQKKSFSDLRKLEKAKKASEIKKQRKYISVLELKRTNELIELLELNLKCLKEGCRKWHSTLMELEQAYEEQEKLLKEVVANGYFNT